MLRRSKPIGIVVCVLPTDQELQASKMLSAQNAEHRRGLHVVTDATALICICKLKSREAAVCTWELAGIHPNPLL